jgi:hypothetical protein
VLEGRPVLVLLFVCTILNNLIVVEGSQSVEDTAGASVQLWLFTKLYYYNMFVFNVASQQRVWLEVADYKRNYSIIKKRVCSVFTH